MLGRILKSLFSRPFTSKYPAHEPVPKRLRGKIKWDERKCIRCKLCVRACPTGACKLISNKIEIDAGLCSYCYNCVEICLKGALNRTSEFELATPNKQALK